MLRIAINGFGRIGRNFLRTILQDPNALKKINVVAINVGPAKLELLAHMFKYDSLMGTYKGTVSFKGDELHIDNQRIKILSMMDPATIPWKSLDIDWVVDATGKFTHRDGAQKHLQAGAKAVLITAPAKDEDVTIIPGVNDAAFKSGTHQIVSIGSCTTNAFLPMLKVLHDLYTIERSFMTTVHAYTNTQVFLDVEASDPRRARAAAINIIPTTTGAMKVMGKVIPDLIGCVEAISLRVPVDKVSLIDLTFVGKKEVSMDGINDAFKKAAESGPMKGIVALTMDPLVSCDFKGDPHSVTIDGLLTATCGERMGKVFGWYDNEWGYSERLKDFLVRDAAK